MKRFDLREKGNDFLDRLKQLVQNELENGEVGIFLFVVDDFNNVNKSLQLAKELNCEIINSLRFNLRDWSLSLRKGTK